MDTSKLRPNDPRVKYETAVVRGKTYSYILGEPQGPKRDTVFLIHGWPDMAFGWRHQIPALMALGFQVVAPDMLGYGGTDAPQEIAHYGLKSVADDMRELAARFVGEHGQIVLGGHDWGGAVVWRLAYWHPRLIKALFAVCTPWFPLNRQYIDLETIVATALPQFAYQLQFAGPEVQSRLRDRQGLAQLFSAIFGGRTAKGGEPAFDVYHGFHFDKLADLPSCPPLFDREELEHYVERYALHEEEPMRGPLNWYRTRRVNYEDEAERATSGEAPRLEMPTLFVAATRDMALPPSMSEGMEVAVPRLTRAELDGTHWVLIQKPDEFNALLGSWLDEVYRGALKASL